MLTETAQPATGAVEAQVLGESLARTGVDVETLVLLACGLVSGGAGLTRSGRRRLRCS